ncbi:MAG: ABC transporter substrate-binding protein [Lachnospiraceae bacterium]
MKKRIIFSPKGITVLMIAFTIFMLAGCGFFGDVKPADNELENSTEDLIVVGYSQIGSESVWRTANSVSIQSALTTENGYFLMFSNARQKQENQIKAIRSFVSQRVDYIVFSPVTEDGWETVLQEAKEAGVPVILADRMISVSDDSLYATWVGSNAREEGEKAGRWLEQYLRKNGRDSEEINIVVLQGTTGSSAQLGRTMGFDSIADQHKNWNILEQASGDFTVAKGKEVMESMLKKYDDIDVIVSQNDDMTFGAMEALNEKGLSYGVNGDIVIISFDAVYDALKMVSEGKINVDIECNPEQGEYISEIIQKIENGENLEKKYYVDEQVFTIDNVNDVLEQRTY